MIAFKQASNLAFVEIVFLRSSVQENDKFQGDLVVKLFSPQKKPNNKTVTAFLVISEKPSASTASTGQGEAPKDQRAEGCAFGEAQGLLGSEDLSF